MMTIYENPICEDRSFRFMVLAFLKYLKILDYRMIQKEDVAQARERFHNELLELDDSEQNEDKQLEQEKKNFKEIEELTVC